MRDKLTIILRDFKASLLVNEKVSRQNQQRYRRPDQHYSLTLSNWHLRNSLMNNRRIHIFSSVPGIFNMIIHILDYGTKLNKFKRTEIMQRMICNNNGIKLKTERYSRYI